MRYLALFITSLFISFSASSEEVVEKYSSSIDDIIETKLKPALSSNFIIEYVLNSNKKNANLSDSQKKEINIKWKREERLQKKPLRKELINNNLSAILKNVVKNYKGLFTQIEIIDSNAIVIGASIANDRIYYGEAPLWQEVFAKKTFLTSKTPLYYSYQTKLFQMNSAYNIFYENKPIAMVKVGIDVEKIEDWIK